MVTTRNQNSRNDGNGPTLAEFAELLRVAREELEKTQAELRNVTAQRDAFARVIQDSADTYPHRNRRDVERSPTHSGVGATPSNRPIHRRDVEAPHGNEDGNGGGRSAAFEYGNFMKCKPESFKGGHDPVVNLRWLSQMEVVFESCDCSEEKKVLFASRMLKESALDWWNGRKAALGTDYISKMTWNSFFKLFEAKYCTPRDKIVMEREFLTLKKGDKLVEDYVTAFYEKLQFCAHLCPDELTIITRFIGGLPAEYRGLCRTKTTMNDVIDEAKHIEDDLKLKGKKEGNSEWKRKNEEDTGSSKKPKNGSSYEGKEDKKASKWCSSCRAFHDGMCSEKTRRCDKCGKLGHIAPNCKDKSRCYKCGETGHLIADCPQRKDDVKKDDIPKAKTRAYKMITTEDESDNEVPYKVVF